MKHHSVAVIATVLATLVFVGCSGEDARVAPLKTDTEAAVKAAIPPFLSLASVETEVIPFGENRVKITFKSKVRPLEDLFIEDRFLDDDRSVMVLKKTQSSGTEANLYGSMLAERTMDKWDFSYPEIDSGMAQLGSPRGSFDPRAMIDGSDEMKNFIAAREAELAELARVEEEERRKSEEARIALMEQKRLEAEATRKKLSEATAVGKRYRGIMVFSPGGNEERQAVELQFLSKEGNLITAEFHNPDEPAHKQTFTGELVFERDPNANTSGTRHYPIVLSPKSTSRHMQDRWRVYFEECVVRLDLGESGLEGEAYARRSNSRFGFHLQEAQ